MTRSIPVDMSVVSHSPARRATITDVARLAGVSIATVSRVVNGTAPVADETVDQVRKAIRLLNYKPLTAARTLAGRRTETIGLLLPNITDAFFTPLMRGVEIGAREAGYDLLIHLAGQGTDEQDKLALPLDEHNTDGLLVFTGRLDDGALVRLWQSGMPMVLLYRSAPQGTTIPCVHFENCEGARRLVDHLLTVHGRRRIGYLSGPVDNEDSQQREVGYRQALADHGIAYDAALVRPANFNNANAQAAVKEWLQTGVEFDAIFAADDEAAAGAMVALRQAHKQVPDDVAVVGFDDLAFSHLLSPPLTTERAPVEMSGLVAARLLIRQVYGGYVEKATVLSTELVLRQSCGCP